MTDLIEDLTTQPIIAVDTESDSLYSYFEKVCLIQISTAEVDYIVDPLAVDVMPLGAIFANPGIQKILHAAEYDVMTLRRDYGFQIHNLFDTMLAARVLGWPKFGLGHILKAHFNIRPDKRFQQYNWGRRPLAPEALDYACLDTRYLMDLRAIQAKELQRQGRVEEAAEIFERMTHARSTAKVFDPADFWSIKGAKDLSSEQLGVLQVLYVYRDRVSRRTNRPPFKVINDRGLVQIVQQTPRTLDHLRAIRGVGERFVDRHGQDILKFLKQMHPAPPVPTRAGRYRLPDPITQRYEYLRSWRNHIAKARGVEPDVILSNDVLISIAKCNPATPEALKEAAILGTWQFKTYADDIMEQLERG